MSLFGSSPENSSGINNSAQKRSSLFADDSTLVANSTSSLFADDGFGSSSPWNNSIKRTARHELVKTLLPATDVPEAYVDAYDLVLNVGDRVRSGIGLTAVREVLAGSGLNATDQAKILNLVVSGEGSNANSLGRPEFNVLLALMGLAQEGEDITLDAVDERRKSMASSSSPSPRHFVYCLFFSTWSFSFVCF